MPSRNASAIGPTSSELLTVRRSSPGSITRRLDASDNAVRTASRGRVPGDSSVTRQSPEPMMAPSRRAGITPARTSDDFPEPDGPVTITTE